VAATKESVVTNIRAAKRAGFKVVDVDLIPFAVIRALPEAQRAGVQLFVHVGATSTSVVVADRGVPQFVRMLPNGGNDVTQALVEQLGLRADRAEDMKRRYGIRSDASDPQSEFVARMNAEGARDIVQAARSTVTFFENARPHDDGKVDGVVLSGGGSQLRGLADEIAEATGLPVTTGRGDAGIAIGPGVDETALLSAGVTPAVAVGLALRSFA
jgi:type IV pilus assembly protein PilM